MMENRPYEVLLLNNAYLLRAVNDSKDSGPEGRSIMVFRPT